MSAQTLKPDASIDLPSANRPCRSTWQLLACDSLVDVFLPAFTTPSTVVQFAERGSAASSQTRSALREFVTVTVTVGANAVFALGLGFAGATLRVSRGRRDSGHRSLSACRRGGEAEQSRSRKRRSKCPNVHQVYSLTSQRRAPFYAHCLNPLLNARRLFRVLPAFVGAERKPCRRIRPSTILGSRRGLLIYKAARISGRAKGAEALGHPGNVSWVRRDDLRPPRGHCSKKENRLSPGRGRGCCRAHLRTKR